MAIKAFDIDQGYTLFSKGNYRTRQHQHYAIEVVLVEEGSFDIATAHQTFTGLTSAIIPANLLHRFNCADAKCRILFLDPLSPVGQHVTYRFQLHLHNSIVVNHPGLKALFEGKGIEGALKQPSVAAGDSNSLDLRVVNCLQEIEANLGNADLTIGRLTAVSFLSESRLSHLFKHQMGISIRQYILWKKILLAVSRTQWGLSLTESALAAGFTDSSHFCKVFSKMFGVNPFFALKS